MIVDRSRRIAFSAQALALALAVGWATAALAQYNTRLLVASNTGVPEHAGFAFGPFSHVSMNRKQQIVFLSSLVSPRTQLNAVVRSQGVSFAVVAFQGLRSPVSGRTFDSFDAPSMNDSGQIAFSATLRGSENGQPAGAGVFRATGANLQALATTDQVAPDGTNFQDFSSALIGSAGNVLFGARTARGSGLFYWTPAGVRQIALPPGFTLAAQDLLDSILASADQGVFAPRSSNPDEARDQLFRALATKMFQTLSPPPPPEQTVEILPARPGAHPVEMLIVALEGEKVELAALQGDPTQAVQAKATPGTALKPFGQIEGQAAAAGGNILFAATPADQQNDLALYCDCDGQIQRLTTADDFLAITAVLGGRTISSLTSDMAHTAAFIAPTGPGSDMNAIYITSLP